MEVEIIQFRNLTKRNFNFEEGLNLLAGQNGKGKSNTFACIEWVLYGVGSALPWGKKKAEASVIFPLKKVKITRKKGPELLILNKEESEYIDKDAQEIINGIFGTYETWKATCFIPQETRCRLLSGTKEQQINALNSIIFSNSDPHIIQKKIEEKRKEEDQQLRCLKAKIEGMEQGMPLNLKEENISVEQLITMRNFFELKVKTIEQLILQAKILLMRKKTLEEERLKFLPTNEKIKTEEETKILQLEIQNLRQKHSKAQFYQIIKTNLESLENQMKDLEGQVDLTVSEDKLGEVLKNEMDYTKYSSICNDIGVKYEKEEIEMKKKEFEYFYNLIPKAEQWFQISIQKQKLEAEIKTNKNFLTDRSSELEKLKQEIFLLEKNKDLIQCPSCNRALCFKDGKLSCADGFVINNQDLEKKKSELKYLQAYQERQREFTFYLLQANELNQKIKILQSDPDCDKILSLVQNIEACKNSYQKLKVVEFMEEPISFKEYEKKVKMKNLYLTRETWKQKLQELDTGGMQFNIDEMNLSLKILEEEHQISLQAIEKEKVRRENLEKIDKALEAIIIPEDLELDEKLEAKEKELLEAKNFIININEKLEEAKQAEQVKEKKDFLNSLKKESDSKADTVGKIEVIKDICRKVQSERIDYSLTTLNEMTNTVLKEMFEEPICIEIKTMKQTKQGKIKNELTLNIQRNTDELDSLNDLSVGQASRVSMALSIALFLLTSCPFILMDETFAPVDMYVLDKSLQVIKEHLPKGRICIISAHNQNGLYDHVIEL